MPLNWNVSILAQPSNPVNWLVAAIYDASAPSVLVEAIPLPKPYGDTKNITFVNLDGVVYDFKLFESATTSPVGTVLNTFSFQPALGTITTIREDLYLTGNSTPGFPTEPTGYDDNSLIGWIFDIERVGIGTLEKGVDYELTLDGNPEDSTNANGWRLIQAGDIVGSREKFVLHFQPQVTSSTTGTGGGGGSMIAGSVILDQDIALDNTYMKKACLLQGAGVDHFTVILPPLISVADNQIITFISAGGDHVNVTLEGDNDDSILYHGIQENIILGQCEQVSMFKAFGMWNIIFPDGNFKTVGEIIFQYVTQELNTVFANGTLKSRTANARLWKFVSQLPAAQLIDDSQWNVTQVVNGRTVYVNRGKFTRGDGENTFRVPMIYSVGNLKAVDGSTRLASSYEADMVGPFTLSITIPASVTSTSQNGSGRIVGGSDSKEPVNMESFDASYTGGNETKQANFGAYALIRS